ncbi:MAG: nucleotidyltransferase [Xanthomonadales bacterium]|nr:nucleotidyltransferase [Xanthomonadales bacterium]MBK7146336.1 nucleotidyltransferase [Xanthomonadales bacterium]
MELIPDLKEFIRLLDAHDVRYLVVGGAAVNALGYVRSTEDIDFWLQRSEENATRTLSALHDFGFDEFTWDDLLDPKAVLMLGRPPNRIDLLIGISGREFDDCYPRRLYGNLGGVRIPLIALEDLLINKRASGRAKDLADIEEFEKSKQLRKGAD